MTTPTTITVSTPEPKPARPKTPSRLRTWEPDHRWAHPVAGALWVFTIGVVAHVPAFGIPPWTLAVVGIVGAAAGVSRARRSWPERTYGDDIALSLSVLAVLAGALAGAWLVWACATSPFTAAGWLVLATVWVGLWYAHIRSAAPKAAAKIQAAQEAAEVEAATATWTEILKASRLGLKVVETRPTRAGFVIGVDPIDDTKPVTFETLQSRQQELNAKASAMLARDGVTVRAGTIRFERTEADHVHLIHVCTKNVLALSIPFERIEQASTIADPIDFALYEDGRAVEITLGGELGGTSGKIVGATGSGKTRLANSIIGRIGENVDALNVVVASNKLVPLTYPWLRPWLDGRAPRPGIDWIGGQSPQRVLEVLAAIYRIVVERNNSLSNESTHVPTPQAPAIAVWVEEAGDLAARNPAPKIVTFDGQAMTFSRLIHEITRQCRSAQVSVFLMNQTDLYGSSGEFGPEIARNTPFRVCLKTLAPQDGPSVLPGLSAAYSDTSKLRHNSMLVQPSTEDPRVMPAKAYNLGGNDVHSVAIANAAWRPELEPSLAALLGDTWTNRWDAARLPELVAAAAKDGLEWPVGRPEDPIDVELRQLLEDARPEPAAAPVPDGEFPDAEEAVAELTAIANQPALTVPEPLASVLGILSDPQAPKDFISTRQLAILLERCADDASDEDLTEAARQLGREMSAIDPEIRSEQKKAVRGYDVAMLRRVAAKIAKGESR